MHNKTIRQQILFLIITITIFFNLGCKKSLSDYIPNNLDAKKNILLLQKINKNEDSLGCNKSPKLCKIFKDFDSSEFTSGYYNYQNIKIQLHIIQFSSCDDSFGAISTINRWPERLMKEKATILSLKTPYYIGYKGKYLVVFKSKPFNYFSFYKNHALKILNSLDNSRLFCKLQYHHKILPKPNRYKNSLFFTRNKELDFFDFNNAYAAYYQTEKTKSIIYVDNLYDEKVATKKFNIYLQDIRQKGFKINRYLENIGGAGITYWYKERSKNITMIHKYRWINIIIKNIPRLSYGNSFLKSMYKNMFKIRKKVKVN